MKSFRYPRRLPSVVGVLGIAMLIVWSCGGSVNKEKTAAQRAEEYHKNLTTDDLSLMELRGNVLSVVYPGGFVAQYDRSGSATPDSITFSTTGLCETLPVADGDSLQAVRNTVGAIMSLARPDGTAVVSFVRNADGVVTSWTTDKATYAFSHNDDGTVSALTVKVNGQNNVHAKIKIVSKDNIGNWIRREILFDNAKPIVQQRRIIYY